MNELAVHPDVYATARNRGLISLLERVWLREQEPGEGTLYVISGFATYNGGVRFFPVFRRHVELGGRVVALFAGSTGQNLASRQVVQGMLECGAEVRIVNRKRLMHVKSYGSRTRAGDMVVVSSGNFTGPGMAQNVEMSVLLDRRTARGMGFSWEDLIAGMLSQSWQMHRPELQDMSSPGWRLLYDEEAPTIVLDETDEVTLIVILGHADTVRINAAPGTVEARGTQYFWLSRDCYDFFPALTIPNARGVKRTYSCVVGMNFVDLGRREKVRVTFEAENNLDFRLGAGALRGTGLVRAGDVAAISRIGESSYELRLYRCNAPVGERLAARAVNFVGNRGKRYGFVSNDETLPAFGPALRSACHKISNYLNLHLIRRFRVAKILWMR